MLQQTRVDTVIPYYERFLGAFPTVSALAEAPEEQVLALWSGLGYYRRARMLHAAARRVASSHQGKVPSEVADLRGLEGVGAYTAGAIASIAFGRRAALVDGNVARVLARLWAVEDDVTTARGSTRLWKLAEELLPDGDGDPGDWNQALMELGAVVCLPRTPRCDVCPVRDDCAARRRGIAPELPRKSPKRAPLEVHRVALVLASESSVVLARRRRDTLFGGLWEPPHVEGDGNGNGTEDAARRIAARLGARAAVFEAVGELTHVLSHRRMRIGVIRGPLGRQRQFGLPGPEYDSVEVVRFARVGERPHGSLARRILEVAKVPESGLP
jgi:A/G-specific adenine glycosylase